MDVPRLKMSDGREIPAIGLGTYLGFDKNRLIKPKKNLLRDVVLEAINIGYRHFDTATVYDTEEQVGDAIRLKIEQGVVSREDVFITAKLWNTYHRRLEVGKALRETMTRTGLNYIDLYLMHWPIGLNTDYSHADVDFIETWRGLEDMQRVGVAKSIGVSNFNKDQLQRILNEGTVRPVALQIEVHPQIIQEDLINFARSQGIIVIGYSPFGSLVMRFGKQVPGPKMDDPVLVEIAQKYGKTSAQVVLRWLVDRNVVPIPKTVNPERLVENINIFDFKLEQDEIEKINQFNSNTRFTLPSFWQSHLHYPFEQLNSFMDVPRLQMSDGREIPAIGLGTYRGFDKNRVTKPKKKLLRDVILDAIDIGYRYFDTATVYDTEAEIGEAIRMKIEQGAVSREDVFITAKLWNNHRRGEVAKAMWKTLKHIGLSYVDLYLMHWPIGFNADYSHADVDFMETWRGLEDMHGIGVVKSIGVSNFNKDQLQRVLNEGTVRPVALQIEVHPQIIQEDLINFARSQGIIVIGYSPFGSLVMRFGKQVPGPKMDDPVLVEIAQKYGKTSAQVVLRWLVDRNVVPIPKTVNPERLVENINIFDFKLEQDEIEKINQFNSKTRFTLP